MSATCPHGLPQAECLICKTLGMQPAPTRTSPRPGPGPGSAPSLRREEPGREEPVRAEPVGGVTERPGRHHFLVELGAVVLAVLAIAVLAWLVVGAVFAVLHVIELILVALIAGWAGYRLGRYRGRRER